jgi:hypothetical protein
MASFTSMAYCTVSDKMTPSETVQYAIDVNEAIYHKIIKVR